MITNTFCNGKYDWDQSSHLVMSQKMPWLIQFLSLIATSQAGGKKRNALEPCKSGEKSGKVNVHRASSLGEICESVSTFFDHLERLSILLPTTICFAIFLENGAQTQAP